MRKRKERNIRETEREREKEKEKKERKRKKRKRKEPQRNKKRRREKKQTMLTSAPSFSTASFTPFKSPVRTAQGKPDFSSASVIVKVFLLFDLCVGCARATQKNKFLFLEGHVTTIRSR